MFAFLILSVILAVTAVPSKKHTCSGVTEAALEQCEADEGADVTVLLTSRVRVASVVEATKQHFFDEQEAVVKAPASLLHLGNETLDIRALAALGVSVPEVLMFKMPEVPAVPAVPEVPEVPEVTTTPAKADTAAAAALLIGGHQISYINWYLFISTTVIVLALAGSALLEAHIPALKVREERPALWVWVSLFLSYFVLLPTERTQLLFCFKMDVVIMGNRGSIREETDETMFGFIRLLWDTGSHSGAAMLVLYAMVVPIVKIILLLYAEYFRYSRPRFAWWGIAGVQVISKWACPDMFAYILLLALFRRFDENSEVVEIPTKVELGFISFSGFCILSTLSSLAVKLPELEEDSQSPQEPFVLRFFGRRGIFIIVLSSFAVFAVTMSLGILGACMGVEVTLLPGLKAVVGIQPATNWLVGWTSSNDEAVCMFAALILFGFVIVCTYLDMLVLLAAAINFLYNEDELTEKALSVAHVLKHVSMLDVLIFGIIIVCCVARVYEKDGVKLILGEGLWLLIVAEAMHYLAYYIMFEIHDYIAPREHKRGEQEQEASVANS